MGEFCEYLEQIKAQCNSCYENGIGACHIKLGPQEYYGKFGLNDTIQIIRHDGRLSVETDIEVEYKTNHPYGVYAGKGTEFAVEQAGKERALVDFLKPKLPSGVTLRPSHLHYFPDKHDPEIVALHIHAYKNVEDLDEAKIVAAQLAERIKPREIEALLKEAKGGTYV